MQRTEGRREVEEEEATKREAEREARQGRVRAWYRIGLVKGRENGCGDGESTARGFINVWARIVTTRGVALSEGYRYAAHAA